MKTHELKLDIKYFDDVKSGKKNFEIRKNDRDFKVGDVLELKAWNGTSYICDVGGSGNPYAPCHKDWADTIEAKITMINNTEEFNMGLDFGDKIKKDFLCTNIKYPNAKPFMASEVRKILNDYFSIDRLPDGYVILGIEVME